jgi:DNA-binding MarR family transcriptional regulator
MATGSLTRLYDRALSRAGLRATGFAILSVLAGEGPIPVSGLAERLSMDGTTCTREVGLLADDGLVEIAAGSDGRQRLLRLTDLGELKRSAAGGEWEQVQEAVADEFGDEGIRDLLARHHLPAKRHTVRLGHANVGATREMSTMNDWGWRIRCGRSP